MKRQLLHVILVLVLLLQAVQLGPVLAQNPSSTPAKSGEFGAVESITAAQLRDYLYVVASDEMEGRDTPSRGLD
ncbi:MAG: hypothetical protein ACOYLN_06915, partial [Blastocatellia bacterium]